MALDLKIRISLLPVSCWFVVCSATLRTQNFSKEKKKKRKPVVEVKGFKKASFSEKILPDT
jgi:hypothetical protein